MRKIAINESSSVLSEIMQSHLYKRPDLHAAGDQISQEVKDFAKVPGKIGRGVKKAGGAIKKGIEGWRAKRAAKKELKAKMLKRSGEILQQRRSGQRSFHKAAQGLKSEKKKFKALIRGKNGSGYSNY